MKKIPFLIILAVFNSNALADQVVGEIEDKYVTKVRKTPVTTQECSLHRVPVYSEAKPNKDAAFGNMILGAAIGSAIGNEISDGKGVGTIGGIIGAKIASDNSQGSDREVVAYSEEERCKLVKRYEEERIEEYSHSYVTFELNGRRHRVRFTR